MSEINISRRGEMSEEERIQELLKEVDELQSEVDDLTEENSKLENQVSEQTKRAKGAEALLKRAKKTFDEIESAITDFCQEQL